MASLDHNGLCTFHKKGCKWPDWLIMESTVFYQHKTLIASYHTEKTKLSTLYSRLAPKHLFNDICRILLQFYCICFLFRGPVGDM